MSPALRVVDRVLALEGAGLSGRPHHPCPVAVFQTPPSGILGLLEWVL